MNLLKSFVSVAMVALLAGCVTSENEKLKDPVNSSIAGIS